MKYAAQVPGSLFMSTSSRRRWLATLLALLVVASACGGTASTVSSSGGFSEPEAADELFTGEFATVSGQTIDLGSLEGQDTVLWFWAPW